MKNQDIEDRLKGIFNALFNCPIESVGPDSAPSNTPGWDSMQHLNLVTSVESEFGITLDEQQVVDMLSFALIVEIVRESVAK